MTSDNTQSARLAATQAVGSVWWYFLFRALLLLGAGLFMIFKPDLSLIAFAQVIAILILVDGILALVAGFTGQAESRFWSILRGALMLAAGLFVLFQPALVSSVAVKTVLFLVAPFVILSGILEIVGSFKHKDTTSDKKGSFFSGLLTTLFGILLILAPMFFGEVIVRILGVIAVLMAIPLFFLAMKFRKVKHRIANHTASSG